MKKLLILATLCANIAQASFKSYFKPSGFMKKYVEPVQNLHSDFYRRQFELSDSIVQSAKKTMASNSYSLGALTFAYILGEMNIAEKVVNLIFSNPKSALFGFASAAYAINKRQNTSSKPNSSADGSSANNDDNNFKSNALVAFGSTYASILACKAIAFATEGLRKDTNIKPFYFIFGGLCATSSTYKFTEKYEFKPINRKILTCGVGLASLALLARYGE